MKNMQLRPDNDQFKIGDTSTNLRFSALEDNAPADFSDDDQLLFQIREKDADKYLESAKGSFDGTYVNLNSMDLANLAVGHYELELWVTHNDGSIDIFPALGFVPFEINENALGDMQGSVYENTFSLMQTRINQMVQNAIDTKVATLDKPKDGTNGINGQTPTISVAPTLQTDPGTQATVKDIGGSLDHIFQFSIPKASVEVSPITSNTLDNCKGFGLYIGNGTGTDAPTQNRYTLLVIADNNGGSQLVTDLTDGRVWSRTFSGTTWTEWRQVTQWN